MTDWRTTGCVQDSEEDSFDETTHIWHSQEANASTDRGPHDRHTQNDAAAAFATGQGGRASYGSLEGVHGGHSPQHTTKPNSSPISPEPHAPSPQSKAFTKHGDLITSSDVPSSSTDASTAGLLSSDIFIAMSGNAVSDKYIPTRLSSDRRSAFSSNFDPTDPPPGAVTPPRRDFVLDQLRQASTTPWQCNVSTASSPLSDARSDIEPPDHCSWSKSLHALRALNECETGARHSVHAISPSRCPSSPDEADTSDVRIRRELRKRNPIQIHPYILEAEKYKQNLRSRGLKPVNVPEDRDRAERYHRSGHKESQDVDHQDGAFVIDHSQSSSLQHCSPFGLSSPSNNIQAISVYDRLNLASNVEDESMDVHDDDDEIPTLADLLKRKQNSRARQPSKRRKASHIFSNEKSLSQTCSPHEPLSSSKIDISANSNALFNAPSSPPISEVLHNNNQQLRYRSPPKLRLLSPIPPLQHAKPTAAFPNKPGQVISVGSDSDDAFPISTSRHRRNNQRIPSSAVISSTSSSDECGTQSNDKRLQQARKRIKGVLPASWLRLDQQAQANKEPYTCRSHSQGPKSTGSTLPMAAASGNSTRVASLAPSNGRDNGVFTIPEDDTSDSDAGLPAVEGHRSALGLEAYLGFAQEFDCDAFEVEEHDWVDPMLPSVPRKRVKNRSRGQRQLKLTDTMDLRTNPPRLDQFDRPARTRLGKLKPDGNNRQFPRRIAKNRPPKLSILDAPILNHEESVNVPKFLRIAARQALRHPNKGRHSPTNKRIRLKTEADTEDANSVLREWRAGKINRSIKTTIGSLANRPPAYNSSANVQGVPRQQYLPEHTVLSKNPRNHVSANTPGQQAVSGSNHHSESHQTKLNLHVIPMDMSQSRPSKRLPSKPKISVAYRSSMQKQIQKQPGYRTAQLEGPQGEHESEDRMATFRRKLMQLNRSYADLQKHRFRDARTGHVGNPQLARFLEDKDEMTPLPPTNAPLPSIIPSMERKLPPLRRPGRRLKAKAQRVDVETREHRQPSDPIPQLGEQLCHPLISPEARRLEGLGPYGTRYPTDFDVSRLWSGTFFHANTFIGCGDLHLALNTGLRNLDTPSGFTTITHNTHTFRWGAWTEEVASEISSLVRSFPLSVGATERLTTECLPSGFLPAIAKGDICLLRNIVRYFSTNLHFLDSIDRNSFVTKMHSLLDSVSGAILMDNSNHVKKPIRVPAMQQIPLQLLSTLSLLAWQVSTIASGKESNIAFLLKRLIRSSLQTVLAREMGEIRSYIDENRRHAARELGIRDDKPAIETLVVINHVLHSCDMPDCSLWQIVRDEWADDIANCSHIQYFERLWYNIFALLPYLDIDSSGLVKPAHRVDSDSGCYSVVVPMLNRLFVLYQETAQTTQASINAYIRSCLTRCYNLIHTWGLKKCDTLLTSIFDFFSHRGFTNLHNEDNRGSPRFLEDMHQHAQVDVQSDDRAFHIFLKSLVIGFRGLREICDGRQLQSIAWRMVPNHRRTFHKEEELKQEDLDGLRNQHDLLCTLYWASPPGTRPRLTSLRNLVDQNRSHRQVCRLSVRAWSNLVRDQMSTEEGIEPLAPFADWFKEIISQNLIQHKLARSEAESHYEAARSSGNNSISREHVQMTIRKNQAQIAATLEDAVYGLKSAIEVAHHTQNAAAVLSRSAITDILRLFDAKNAQVSRVIAAVLEVFQAYLKLLEAKEGDADSLEYVSNSVWQLMSSCFGADISPDEALLMKVTDTWTAVAHHLVRRGKRRWSSFLDSYGANSWHQLQDTEQTRKYTALFLANIVNRYSSSYADCKADILCSWMTSLVERESTLKFQHQLTTSLMNRDPDHPLLRNLPFVVDSISGHVDIKMPEFRRRRLNLISSVLSNMRSDYEAVKCCDRRDVQPLRAEYQVHLERFMAAMKKNYQELGQNSHVKGSYVEFVHAVVEFLQQHTHDIRAVDQFFSNPSAFPLPATDPAYVVGKLKSYLLKLSEPRTLKTLVSFMKNLSERAALYNEQESLISQICSATMETAEPGDASGPTLRQVMLGVIFPTYIEQTFKTSVGWILAKPILQASRPVLEELNYQAARYSVSDSGSVSIVDSLLSIMLDALYTTVDRLIAHADRSHLLEQPHVLYVLVLIFDAVTATVLPAAYMYRRTGSGVAAVDRINAFRAFGMSVMSSLTDPAATDVSFSLEPTAHPVPLTGERFRQFAEVRRLCANELTTALSGRNCVRERSQYFLVREDDRTLVHTASEDLEDGRREVVDAIERFHRRLKSAFWDGEEDLKERRREGKVRGWPMERGVSVVI